MAKSAADRAMEIDPDLPEGYAALGSYYYIGIQDFEKALHNHSIASRMMPNNHEEIEAIAYIWRRQGLLEEALEYLEKAERLAPGQYWYPMQIGLTNCLLRRHEVAEKCYLRSIEIEPDQVAAYAMRYMNEYVWTADLSRMQAVLESIPNNRKAELAPAFYIQKLLKRDPQGAIDEISSTPDRKTYFFGRNLTIRANLEGHAYRAMGDTATASARFEAALVIIDDMLEETEGDRVFESAVRSNLGTTYAGLGRKEDALREMKKAVELVEWDKLLVYYRIMDMAEVCVVLGEYDMALDRIETLLSANTFFSVPVLERTPRFDPLRDMPRYRRIVEKYSERAGS
jgi:tetratricopeptide (TPR) repeat protein